MDIPMKTMWKGRDVDTLDKPELLEVIEYLSHELALTRADRNHWRKTGSAVNYLMTPKDKE